jgi:hypothetical protein
MCDKHDNGVKFIRDDYNEIIRGFINHKIGFYEELYLIEDNNEN